METRASRSWSRSWLPRASLVTNSTGPKPTKPCHMCRGEFRPVFFLCVSSSTPFVGACQDSRSPFQRPRSTRRWCRAHSSVPTWCFEQKCRTFISFINPPHNDFERIPVDCQASGNLKGLRLTCRPCGLRGVVGCWWVGSRGCWWWR